MKLVGLLIVEHRSMSHLEGSFLLLILHGVVKKTVQEWNRSSKAWEPALHTHARQEAYKDEVGTCEDRSGWIRLVKN